MGRTALPVANPLPRAQETNPHLPGFAPFWPSLVSFQLTPGSSYFQAEKNVLVRCLYFISGPHGRPPYKQHGIYSLWLALGVHGFGYFVCLHSQDSALGSTFWSLSIHSAQGLCSKQLAPNLPNSQTAPAKVTFKTPLKTKASKVLSCPSLLITVYRQLKPKHQLFRVAKQQTCPNLDLTINSSVKYTQCFSFYSLTLNISLSLAYTFDKKKITGQKDRQSFSFFQKRKYSYKKNTHSLK